MISLTPMSSVLMMLTLALVGLTACGNGDPMTTSTPEIRSALNEVDDAIVDENHPAASQALTELKRLVIEARDDGVLGDEQSDAILAAAKELLSELRTSNADEPEPGTVTPPAPGGEPDDVDDKAEKPDKSTENDKPDKGKAHDKPDKPDETEEGPGNSEEAPGHQDD